MQLLVGAVALPYATLWASRSGRLRHEAVARRGWHRLTALLAAGVGVLALAGVVPSSLVVTAWVVTLLGVVTFAHTELFVAAERMRSYPDDRALHYDLRTPRTWLVTSARIVSAWGVVIRCQPWLWPALLASSVLFALGTRFVGGAWWLALAGDTLVLGLCCLPFPQLVELPVGFDGDLPTNA
jgi:hypothetical protein